MSRTQIGADIASLKAQYAQLSRDLKKAQSAIDALRLFVSASSELDGRHIPGTATMAKFREAMHLAARAFGKADV